MRTGREERRRDVLFGLLLLFGAAALVLSKLGYLGKIKFWPMLLSVLLLKFFLDGIARRDIGKILFSLAFFIIVNDKWLHLEAITPWTVLGAALLGTIGFDMLFPGGGRKYGGHAFGSAERGKYVEKYVEGSAGRQSGDGADSYYFYCNNTFGGAVKYVTGEIGTVRLYNHFGGMEVFFTDTQPRNGEIYLYLENDFGGTELYIPSGWRVSSNLHKVFGYVEENGNCNMQGSDTIYIEGRVSFGALEIHYI